MAMLASHALYSQVNNFAPLPYPPRGNYGQALVDMEMIKHPELKQVALHVTPAGVPIESDKDRCIMCSSFGRIGGPDIQEDYDVMKSGKEVTELALKLSPKIPSYYATSAPKFEVMAPLFDSTGKIIGVLYLSFGYKKGDNIDAFTKTAHAIEDELKQRIPSKDALLAPAS